MPAEPVKVLDSGGGLEEKRREMTEREAAVGETKGIVEDTSEGVNNWEISGVGGNGCNN